MLYLCEDGSIGGIGGVEEGAGINAETIGPEMEGSGYGALGTRGVGGEVGDYFAGGVVAAEGARCAGETGGWGLGVVAAGAGQISDNVRLGAGYNGTCVDIPFCSLDDFPFQVVGVFNC